MHIHEFFPNINPVLNRRKSIITIKIFIMFTLILFSFASFALASPLQEPSTKYDQLSAYLEEEIDRNVIPALSISVFDQTTNESFAAIYGKDVEKQDLSIQNPMLIGSISKTLTSLAILKLFDENRLLLNRSITEYLPDFTIESEYPQTNITISHLLTQSSGIPDPGNDEKIADDWSKEQVIQSLANNKLKFEPGTQFDPLDINYILLGSIIEQISGQTYAVFMEEAIFAPLNMTHSYPTYQKAVEDQLITGHRLSFGFPYEIVNAIPEYYAPSAGCAVSAVDFNQFLSLLLNEGKLANGSQFITNQTLSRMFMVPTALNDSSFFTLGWYKFPYANQTIMTHSGTLLGYASEIVLMPETQLGFALTFNVVSFLSQFNLYEDLNTNIINILTGETIETSRFGILVLYILFDIAFVGSLAYEGWKHYRFSQRVKKFYDNVEFSQDEKRDGMLKIGFDFGLAAIIIFALPYFIGFVIGRSGLGIGKLWVLAPDFALLLIIMGLSTIAFAIRWLVDWKKRF